VPPKKVLLFLFFAVFLNLSFSSDVSISIIPSTGLDIFLSSVNLAGPAGSGYEIYESGTTSDKIVITNNGTTTKNYTIEIKKSDFIWNDSLSLSMRIPGTTSYEEIGTSYIFIISGSCPGETEVEYYIQYKLEVLTPVSAANYSTTVYYQLSVSE